MSMKSEAFADRKAQLSALIDGELGAGSVAGLCEAWRDDAALRADWHSYQLIGDVMRSEDLRSTAAHDAAFLNRLRQRLDTEPVVLAPQALQPLAPVAEPLRAKAPHRPSRTWRTSAAVAAGFVVVAVGAVSLMRPAPPASEMAAAPVASPTLASARSTESPGPTAAPATLVVNGNLIRDARLDQYLAAHQQLAGGSLLGGHAAFLRQASIDAPRR